MQILYPTVIVLLSAISFILGNIIIEKTLVTTKEEKRVQFIVEIIGTNFKENGWNNILVMGHWPDSFYSLGRFLPFTYSVSNFDNEDYKIEDVVPYHSNIIVIHCLNFKEFEDSMLKAINLPYWHPHANIIVYFRTIQDDVTTAKICFILWYYKATSTILLYYDDYKEIIYVTHYNPYMSENYKLPFEFGCWIAKKIGIPIDNFQDGFICEYGCYNVSLYSKFRANNLGTCIGFNTEPLAYDDYKSIQKLNLFEAIGKNLHGYPLRAYTTEVNPFLVIHDYGNDTYEIQARDGLIWKTMASVLNFTIDLTPSKNVMKLPFNFELNVQQIFSFGHRKADLFLIPIYQIDLVIIEMDQTFAFTDSGVCFAAHRAGFETTLIDIKLLQNHYTLVIKFILSFLGSWIVFAVFFYVENQQFSLDQIGKNFLNTVRNCLTICLYKPPKRGSFRIFLTFSLWGYFVLNFASQAAITSFFTALRKGSEVDTFDDIIEKGYIIEGMASPDIVLPETEERFTKINSKLVPIQNLFTCIDRMKNDSKRFCLIDCAVGRFFESNELNNEGQQFLHIAKDRVHSHYLNMIFPKHSPMTEHFNKYMMILVEAGLIKKWEQYRFSEIKEETPIKPLNMDILLSIFECYSVSLGFSTLCFVVEFFFPKKRVK